MFLLGSIKFACIYCTFFMEHIERRIATSKAQGTPRDFSQLWTYFALYLISYSFTYLLLYCLRPFEYSASACVRYKNMTRGGKPLSLRLPRYCDFDTKLSRENVSCSTPIVRKLPSYKHAQQTHIHTHTELYYADTCWLVSLTISQFERRANFH